MSQAETLLWSRLRAHRLDGRKFRRQHVIGRYIVDFVCLGSRLVIEVDGDSHGDDEAEALDSARTVWLQTLGFRVIRFWNYDVLTNIDGIVESILNALDRKAVSA
jgi:very-short-patch-repair endonuclease